ncbi:hypothetical protein TKK_0001043 [Trichogramma kaykai]|uniref:Uncharacterized protein n=1 Tax=Trichogramma kaykai TaxID=54128 RepID=A0ABD2WRT9_9HYME
MACCAKEKYCTVNGNISKDFDHFTDEDDFEFQFLPADKFKNIIKNVKRQRTRDEEERLYSAYFEEKQQEMIKFNHDGQKLKSSKTLEETFQDVDRELTRLDADLSKVNTHKFSKRRIQSANCERRDSHVEKENCDCCTNILLTEPQKGSSCCISDTSGSHNACRTYIRKSLSEQTLKNIRPHYRCHRYKNNFECNSSPEVSPDRFSNDEDYMPVHPDPLVVTKILNIQRKISIVLENISCEIDRIPLPDGEDDYQRRQQRVVEFSTRLSRNYLYDLGRQIADILKHIKAIDPSYKMRLCRRGVILHMQAIEQKLLSAHQLTFAALSAYCKHIPCSVLKNNPGKLQKILQTVVQLKNICLGIKLTPDQYSSGDDKDTFLGKETESRCTAILNKFRAASEHGSQFASHTTRSSIMTPTRNNKQQIKSKIAHRLSMYAPDFRLLKTYQPKKTHSMFQITKNRKPNCLGCKQQSNPSMLNKKSNSLLAKTDITSANKIARIDVPQKEDDIQTIMETVPLDSDIDSHRSAKCTNRRENFQKTNKLLNTNSNLKEAAKLTNSKFKGKELLIDQSKNDEAASLLPVIGDLLSLVQSNDSKTASIPPSSIDTLYKFLSNFQTQVETKPQTKDDNVIGTKNTKLISCIEKKDELEQAHNVKPTNPKKNKQLIKSNDFSCQTIYGKNSEKIKLKISDKVIAGILNYQNQYEESLKSNLMYNSNSNNKPWDVVSWISDKLVEELIVDLSDDFQMDDIIHKLFDLEFQEF